MKATNQIEQEIFSEIKISLSIYYTDLFLIFGEEDFICKIVVSAANDISSRPAR